MARTRDSDAADTSVLNGLRTVRPWIRPNFRKAMVYGLLALIGLVAGVEVDGLHAELVYLRLIGYGCAALTGAFGVLASQAGADEVRRIAVARAGEIAGSPLRLIVLLVGYMIVGAAVCKLVGIDLGQLLVGGAITGIIVGLAAQPVLSNLFAGLVLLFARPYLPGQQVRVLAGSINGPLVGVVTSAGLLYTVLETAEGPLNIPNSALLTAAVGPAAQEDDDEPAETAAEPPVPVQDGAAAGAMAAAQSEETSRRIG